MITPAARLNVLFVDDDPLILQGLQRMLRPMRNDWAMTFVESGPGALEAMEQDPFEVVVSDMRMPGMNGAQLLTEIKNKYPLTVRLILSGHADKELILQCVGTAHQFLVKPCNPETLRSAITRAKAFNNSVKSKQIQKLVVDMDRIPSIPSVYSEMVQKLRDEDISIEEIGEIIAKDLAITAKLLKLVNSAFFGLCRPVASPAEAAAYLGVDTMKSLVLSVHAFSSFEGAKIPGITLESLWSHSLEVGSIARKICESERLPRAVAEESFIAGMLHDIGKVVLAVNLPGEYESVLQRATQEKIPLFRAEEEAFGANHADVGGFVLSLWGLPIGVVEAITHHHELEALAPEAFTPAVAVHIANAIVHHKTKAPYAENTWQKPVLAAMGVKDTLTDWMSFAV